ncbi:MAG TPA: class I SAM-dependent methyltransferase [Sediminispirochaeta sp.]|nr:class I SAM-dependent methyltransferase [Sediminispirochaeta sp.]
MKTFSKNPQEKVYRRVDCPVCGRTESRVHWNIEACTFSRCRRCGALFQNPQPQTEELHLRYDEAYFHYERENEEDYFELARKGLEDVDFFTQVEPELFESRKEPRILDVGCATGRLLEYMKGRGWREKGVEVCVPSAEYARKRRGLDVLAQSVESLDGAEATFSVVHAAHLIEHLNDPRAFVQRMYRLLKPGGYLILTTPNSDGLQARLFAASWRSAIPDHMVLFSKKSLAHLLVSAGFRVEKLKTWGGMAQGIVHPIIKRPIDGAAKRFGWGDVMIVRARKASP